MNKLCTQLEKFALDREKHKQITRRLEKGKRSAFWPSEASIQLPGPILIGKCHRALWWDFKGQPISNPMDGRGWRTVKAGIAFESLLIENLKEMNVWNVKMNDSKKFFNKELNISGDVDAFITWDNQSVGLEVKTIYGWYARKEVFIGRTPKTEHLLQTALYTYHFNLPFKLIYCTRDTQELTEFDITLQDKNLVMIDGDVFKSNITIDGIKNRFEKFQKALDEDKIPARDYSVLGMTKEELEIQKALGELNKTDSDALAKNKKIVKIPWQCSYCPYFHFCRDQARKESGHKGRDELLFVDEDKKLKNQNVEEKQFTTKRQVKKRNTKKTGRNSKVKTGS